jgi:hypothetical protein
VRLTIAKPEDGSDPHLRNSSYSGRLLGTVRSPCDKRVRWSTRWSCVGQVRVEPTDQGPEGAEMSIEALIVTATVSPRLVPGHLREAASMRDSWVSEFERSTQRAKADATMVSCGTL